MVARTREESRRQRAQKGIRCKSGTVPAAVSSTPFNPDGEVCCKSHCPTPDRAARPRRKARRRRHRPEQVRRPAIFLTYEFCVCGNLQTGINSFSNRRWSQGMESHEVHFFHDQAGGGREKNNVINCIILSASFRAQNRRKDAGFSFRHFLTNK